MRILRRLFNMFARSGAGRAQTHTHAHGGGVATRTAGGGLLSMARRFLRR